MESTTENINEVENERVEQGTDKEMEVGEQSQIKETESTNRVGEEASFREQRDSPCPMITEEDNALASNSDTPTLDKETDDGNPPKIDDEKNSQLETSPHVSPSPSVDLDPEEGFNQPIVEETVEHNIESSNANLNILKIDGDSVMVDEDTTVAHEEMTTIPDTILYEEKSVQEHNIISSGDLGEYHANTVMGQDMAGEEPDMVSSDDQETYPIKPDNKLVGEKGSPHHHTDTVMEQEKFVEEDLEVISSRDIDEYPEEKGSQHHHTDTEMEQEKSVEEVDEIIPSKDENDTNVVEENNEKIDEGGADSMNLTDHGSGPVDHDQRTTTEPGSETVTPATKDLIQNEENSDKELPLLPTRQTSSDQNKKMVTLVAEPIDDVKLDVPDSKLVTNANVNKDVNVEAPTTANSLVPERSGTENTSVRREPGPLSVKSEVGVGGGLRNGVHRVVPAIPAKRSVLVDDTTSEGYESGTEDDQSAFRKELSYFFRERNMEFKPPKFYGVTLNCLKLWRAVTRLGGYDKVTGCKLWRQVGESFRPPKTCTTVSWTFRGFYEKALLEYERHKVSQGELHIAFEPEPMSIDNQASGSGRARRDSAARAMQGWHLNSNSEVSDPAFKVRQNQIGTTPGLLKRKRPSSNAIQVSKSMLDVTVVDVGPPADWVKINVQRTQDCFEVYALIPGLVREEVRVQSDPAGGLVISGEPENPLNPWGATPFKKVVSLPARIDPHHTSAVVTLNGQLFIRVPVELSG